MMNKLLKRQVQKHIGDPNHIPSEFQDLLNVISESYDHYEKDHKMLVRSIDLSSNEMIELNANLKKEAEELQKVQYEINQILTNVDEVIFSMDMISYRYIYISNACEKVYGYSVNDFINQPMLWKDVVYAEDQHLVDPQDERLFAGEQIGLEYRINHKNGTLRWVNARVTPTLDNSGQCTRIDVIVHDVTERKKVQQKLEEAHSELNKLLDAINDTVFSVDMTTYTLSHISSACAKIYGYTPAEFYQDPDLWRKVVHTDDEEILEEQFATIYKGETVHNQYRVFHKNGSVRWIENDVIPTMSDKGELLRLDGITRDITDRKHAEEALMQSEQQMREFFQSAPEIIAIIDAETAQLIDCNAKMEEVFKMTRNEIVGKTPVDYSPEWQPDGTLSKDGVAEKIAIVLADGSVDFEWTHVDAEGREFPCEVRLTLLPGGKLLRASGMDISEKKAAEAAIRERDERFRLIAQNPTLGVIWANTKGRLVNVNDAMCNMLGYTREELESQSYTMITHPVDLERDQENVKKVFNGDLETFRVEKRYLTKDKKVIWGGLNLAGVKNEAGRVVYAIGVVQDITPRKKAEQELRNLNESLERKVNERTARLKEANKDLEAFNYTVSHDLRTPLRGIEMFRTLIKRHTLATADDTLNEYLDNINLCTQEMNDMIKNLLEFSKTGRELGSKELNKKEIDMNALVGNVCKTLTSLEKNKQIELLIGDLPAATADAGLMKQVWTNLLSNAIKYSSKNEKIVIEVSGSCTGKTLEYRIKDNGVGFNMNDVDRLFKPFSRLHSAKDFNGNGAGLAIVQKIISFHDGKISASSKPGEGATFKFSLPVSN